MGFHSTGLRQKGWEEQKFRDWNEVCRVFYSVSGLKEKSEKDCHLQIALAVQRCIAPRVVLCEEMDAGAEGKESQEASADSNL